MALTLYHVPGGRSVRPLWVMQEMGLDYRLRTMDFDPEYFASAEYLAINPMGKFPALYDDGELIVESVAIMEYLLGRYGPSPLAAAPDEPEYGRYMLWLHKAEAGITNYLAIVIGHHIWQSPDYAVSAAFGDYVLHQIDKAFAMLDDALEGREFILGRGFSAADISLGYTLYLAETMCRIPLRGRVARYRQTLKALPSWQRAIEGQDP